MPAENYAVGKDHFVSKFRSVFIGHVKTGWYVTSHIHGRMRPYRCHLCHNRFLDRANLRCYGTPGGNVMLLPPKTKIEMPRWRM